jgi:hypothetical protein
MLIGDVGLKTRIMYRKRSGRPRSEISSGGLTMIPALATSHARRASTSLPRISASTASVALAPAMPPKKK